MRGGGKEGQGEGRRRKKSRKAGGEEKGGGRMKGRERER